MSRLGKEKEYLFILSIAPLRRTQSQVHPQAVHLCQWKSFGRKSCGERCFAPWCLVTTPSGCAYSMPFWPVAFQWSCCFQVAAGIVILDLQSIQACPFRSKFLGSAWAWKYLSFPRDKASLIGQSSWYQNCYACLSTSYTTSSTLGLNQTESAWFLFLLGGIVSCWKIVSHDSSGSTISSIA